MATFAPIFNSTSLITGGQVSGESTLIQIDVPAEKLKTPVRLFVPPAVAPAKVA